MGAGVSFYEACRYIFPDIIVETASIEYIQNYDPHLVPYEPGAVGFEFIKIVEIETEDEDISRYVLNRNQYYYWGQKVYIEELQNSPKYEVIMQSSDADLFCLTSWGALVPIDEDDEVIPYPRMIELPSDMRTE